MSWRGRDYASVGRDRLARPTLRVPQRSEPHLRVRQLRLKTQRLLVAQPRVVPAPQRAERFAQVAMETRLRSIEPNGACESFDGDLVPPHLQSQHAKQVPN